MVCYIWMDTSLAPWYHFDEHFMMETDEGKCLLTNYIISSCVPSTIKVNPSKCDECMASLLRPLYG